MNTMITRTINYEKIRPYILVLLTALLAVFAGQGIFKVMAERTLGSILRHNIATIAVLIIVFAFCNEGFILSLIKFKGLANIPKKQLIIGSVFAVLLGAAVLNHGEFDIIYGTITMFILVSMGLAIYYIFSGKSFYALCLFWCAYPFIYYIQTEIEEIGFHKIVFNDLTVPLPSIFISILFVAYILARVKGSNLFLNKRFSSFAFLLIFLSMFPIFFSKNHSKSIVYFIFDMIIPLMYFAMMISAVKDKEQIKKAIKFILFSLTTFSLIVLYFYLRREEREPAFNIYGAEMIMSPGILAFLMAMVLPFSLLLSKIENRTIYSLLSAFFIGFIIVSNSRTPAIGIIITIGSFFLLSSRNSIKKLWSIIAFVVCLALIFFVIHSFNVFPEIRHRVIETVSELQDGVSFDVIFSGRVEIWESAIRMIKDHPIMGIGPGMWEDYAFLYKSKLYERYKPGYGYSIYYSIDAHNFFLDMYLKYGVIVFLLFICFIFYLIRKYITSNKYDGAHKKDGLILTCFISLLVWIFISMFDYRFYLYQFGDISQGLFFWSIIGIFLKSIEIHEKQKEAVEYNGKNFQRH